MSEVTPGPTPPAACDVDVWDGPYRMNCGLTLVKGRCITHGDSTLRRWLAAQDAKPAPAAVTAPMSGQAAYGIWRAAVPEIVCNVPGGKWEELPEAVRGGFDAIAARQAQPEPELQAGPCPFEGHDGEHLCLNTHGHWLCAIQVTNMLVAADLIADPAPDVTRLRAELDEEQGYRSELANDILLNAPESFDGDEAADVIAVRYVRHLEAEIAEHVKAKPAPERDRFWNALLYIARRAPEYVPFAGPECVQVAKDAIEGTEPASVTEDGDVPDEVRDLGRALGASGWAKVPDAAVPELAVADWTADPATGRTNASPAFRAAVQEVDRLLRGGAGGAVLHESWTSRTSALIVAQLAHVHHLSPPAGELADVQWNGTETGREWFERTREGA